MSLRMRHDRDVRLSLLRTKRDADNNLTDLPDDLNAVICDLWHEWTPVDTGLDYHIDKDVLWVFTHPDHGWAVMFVPEAVNRWTGNQHGGTTTHTGSVTHRRDTIKLAVDLSASGDDLTEVCVALLSERNWALSWNSQAVARLVALPVLAEPLREQNVEFMLGLSGLSVHLTETAEHNGYGTPFGS